MLSAWFFAGVFLVFWWFSLAIWDDVWCPFGRSMIAENELLDSFFARGCQERGSSGTLEQACWVLRVLVIGSCSFGTLKSFMSAVCEACRVSRLLLLVKPLQKKNEPSDKPMVFFTSQKNHGKAKPALGCQDFYIVLVSSRCGRGSNPQKKTLKAKRKTTQPCGFC